MFDDGDSAIGLLLLGLCAVVAGVLIWQITTGNRLRYSGPGWLVWVLLILFIGASLYGLARGMGRRWPDPLTGRLPWWRRLFRRRDDGEGQA